VVLDAVATWLKTHEFIAIWLEGVALVAIFFLDWREYRKQGADRIEQHRESIEQMRIMQSHADATKDAAIAARVSTDVLVSSERAWVMGDILEERGHITVSGISESDRITSSIGIELSYGNKGRTPGWIIEKCVWFKIVDRIPAHPTFENPSRRSDFVEPLLEQHRPVWVMQLTCEGEHVVSLSAVPSTEKIVSNIPIIYGYIKYRDTFSTEHETRFGYRMERDGTLVRINLAEYNNYT
jgi:hypothetical protein